MVVVRAVREVGVQTSGVEGAGVGHHLVPLRPAHGDGPVGSVAVIAWEIQIGFQLAEGREDVGECPFLVAPGRPGVEILWGAAQDELAVDRAGAAGRLAAGQRDGRRPLRARDGGIPPVVRTQGRHEEIATPFEVVRQVIERPENLAPLRAAAPTGPDLPPDVSPGYCQQIPRR